MKKNNKGHQHKKKYGQNFLDDRELLSKIDEVTNLSKEDNILEIGPGEGFLTSLLLEKALSVTAFEIDSDLIPVLKSKFKKYENFKLEHIDFLEYDLYKFFAFGKKYKVVANIPYYITAPIINKLLEYKEYIDEIYLMVQKEVAERLSLEFEKSNRGVFTYVVQYYADVDYLFTVGKEMFTPSPKVDSAFIRLKIYKDKKYESLIDNEKFLHYVKASFSGKRKCLTNNLKSLGINKEKTEKSLEKIGKTKMARAEELDVIDFINLINELEKD